MKLTCALLVFLLGLVPSGESVAAKRKKASSPPPASAPSAVSDQAAKPEGALPDSKPGDADLQFDFFAQDAGHSATASGPGPTNGLDLGAPDLTRKANTRRWMLTTHQVLGITTWVLMAATVVVGQLNYNQLYGGGGGSPKWQTPHRWLVLSTSVTFAATGTLAIFAPSPYQKPLHFDSGLVHRIAVAGATLGMLTEIALGWVATHQANAGNQNHLRTFALTHQVVGYSTLGLLTVAGAVWVF